jgi:hypothetical protein
VAETPGAIAVIAHGDDESVSGEAMQFLEPAHDWAPAKGKAGSRRLIVQEHDPFETSCAPGDVQNHLSMPPGPPNEKIHVIRQ